MPVIQLHRTDGSLIAKRKATSLRDLVEALVEQGISLTDANLTDANLTGAQLNYAQLTGANLTGANLTDANLNYAQLTGAQLTGARLIGARLIGAQLIGAQGDILQINGGKHSLIAVPDGQICIGCQTGTYDWWMEQSEMAAERGYDEEMIAEYKIRLDFAKAWIERTTARITAKEVA